LSVVLYELVAGRSPYCGSEHELAARILSDDPLPLPETPRDWSSGTKGTMQAPSERYESVKSFQEDINRFLEGLPVLARGNGAGYRAGSSCEGGGGPISLFVSVAVLILLAGLTFRASRAPQNRPSLISLEASEAGRFGLASARTQDVYTMPPGTFLRLRDIFVKDLQTGRSSS